MIPLLYLTLFSSLVSFIDLFAEIDKGNAVSAIHRRQSTMPFLAPDNMHVMDILKFAD